MSPSRDRPRRQNARSYDEWKTAAIADDRLSGRAMWKKIERSSRYDFKTIRFRLQELREIRTSKDPQRLKFYLKEGLHGNMGGMGSSALYSHAHFGTKDLILHYIQELAEAIEEVASYDETEIPVAEKIELFDRANRCFGRSALMFSGAGSLGPFHLGVARALLEQDLLPTVLSGASAGAFVAALIGSHEEEQLDEYLDTEGLSQLFRAPESDAQPGQRISTEHLREMVESLIPDLTFEEAFELTGRAINISVSPSQLHQRSRLLNAVTSPNVFIREAVMASCAIPGVFPAVTLAAKNLEGERQPYIRSRKWLDGSVTDDQPADRLTRLYGVNHFIASQANPVVLWSLRDSGWQNSELGRLWDAYQATAKEWFRASYPFAMQITKNIYPWNVLTRFSYGIATQDYTADINLLPRQRFWAPHKLLAVLTEEETLALVREGERSTWPKIEMIRNCTLISRTLDRVRAELQSTIDQTSIPQSPSLGRAVPRGVHRILPRRVS